MKIYKRRFSSTLLILLAATWLNTAYSAAGAPPPPVIDARGYLLMDFESGNIISAKKAYERMEPASLTKMMTAYIVLSELKSGRIALTDKVRISEKAWRMEGSRTFVKEGDRVSLEILMKGMIVQSGNDATVALAEYVAGDETIFVSMMNQTAEQLDMSASHFMNSTGWPAENHYTTAHDMAVLARALIRDFPDHYAWYSIKEFTYAGIRQENRNKLLWMDDKIDGLKTGHTEAAGYCLVSSGVDHGMRLVSVVLGAKSKNGRARESQKLLNYGFRFFETHRLYEPMKSLTDVKVWKGEKESLSLGLASEMYVTIARDQFKKLEAKMKVTPSITAPINQGDQLGMVEVSLNGEIVAEAPLIALEAIAEGGFFGNLVDDALMMLE